MTNISSLKRRVADMKESANQCKRVQEPIGFINGKTVSVSQLVNYLIAFSRSQQEAHKN
jgi:hypothetical protein